MFKPSQVVTPKKGSKGMTVWAGKVLATATPVTEKTVGSDGETYYFSKHDFNREMCLVQWFGIGGSPTWWDALSLKAVKHGSL